MSQASPLITGEFRRVFDDRYRIALPPECVTPIADDSSTCILAKEREGCLSLWNPWRWEETFQSRVKVIQSKLEGSLLHQDQVIKVQRFARLLSTRSREIKLGQRGRLLVPEGFREFLAVEPNNEVMVVGAGVCLEIWNPGVWQDYLRQDIGQFHDLLKELF